MCRRAAGALCVVSVALTGCRRAPDTPPRAAATQPAQSHPTTAPPQHNTVPASPFSADCDLENYPVSRSTRDMIADAVHDRPRPRDSMLRAKAVIGPEGKITYLRVISVYAPGTKEAYAINAPAIDRLKQRQYKPIMVEGKPVAVCTDISVNIDFTK